MSPSRHVFYKPLVAAMVTIALLISSSCKHRTTSNAKDLTSDADLLDISKLPLDQQLKICSQNILIVFIGNAQSFGVPHLSGPLTDPVEKQINEHWVASEKTLEQGYFELIKQTNTILKQKIANPNQYCASKNILQQLNAKSMKPGSVIVTSLLDGPNTELWDQTNPDPQALPDSSLTTTRYGFDDQGQWRQLEEKYWSIEDHKIVNQPTQVAFEANVPEALDDINTWIQTSADQINNGRPFTQTSYLLKGHGSRLAKTPYLGIFSSTPLDYALKDAYQSGSPSVFLMDPVDRVGSQVVRPKTFYSLVWSPKNYCRSMCQYQGKDFSPRYDNCAQSCMTQLKADSDQKYAHLIKTLKSQTEGDRDNSQGTRDDSQGTRDDSQGTRDDSQGTRDDSQGEINDTQGGDVLTFGSGQWTSETQGQKATAQYSGTGPAVAGFDGHPNTYRSIGFAKSLQTNMQSGAQSELQIIAGAEARSLVLLDTCSVALWSNHYSKTQNDHIKILRQSADTKVTSETPSDLILLANPMPLLKSAVNYGSLDSFQMVLLSSKLYPTGERTASSANTESDQILSLLIGKKTPRLANTEVFSRLYATKFTCTASTSPTAARNCMLSDGTFTAYIREQLALAARNLNSRLLGYKNVAHELNLSPAMGAGKNLRDVANLAISEKILNPEDNDFWQAFNALEIENIATFSFAEPDQYQQSTGPKDGLNVSFKVLHTWSSSEKATHRSYRDHLSELLVSVFDQAAKQEKPLITLTPKIKLQFALTELASAITIYTAYFDEENSGGLADPWPILLKASFQASSKILASSKLAELTADKRDLIQSIESLKKRATDLHSVFGIIRRTSKDLDQFNRDLVTLRTKLAKAVPK